MIIPRVTRGLLSAESVGRNAVGVVGNELDRNRVMRFQNVESTTCKLASNSFGDKGMLNQMIIPTFSLVNYS